MFDQTLLTQMMKSVQFILLSIYVFNLKCEGFGLPPSISCRKTHCLSWTYNLRKASSYPFPHGAPTNSGKTNSLSKIMLKNNDQSDILSTQNDDESLHSTNPRWSSPLDKPILAALDFVALTIFAAVGKASHSADGSLDIGAVLTTAFPFLVSWFATSPLTGVYNDLVVKGEAQEDNDYLNVVKGTLKGWAFAIPLGCVGRGLIKGYVPPVPFVVVTLIATLIILTTVRLLYSAARKQIE